MNPTDSYRKEFQKKELKRDVNSMAVHDELAILVASPSYPNSIAWSEENLVAIASGHIITILSPASPVHPRGLISLPPSSPFPIGVIKKDDLVTACLMPIRLSRDVRPCARSISWSPQGFAPNSGCLLAVCTTKGRVKLYRSPFCEFRAEWVEVVDISDMLYRYLESINFGELKETSVMLFQGQDDAGHINEHETIIELQDSVSSTRNKRRKTKPNKTEVNKCIDFLGEEQPHGSVADIVLQNTNDGNGDLAASRAKGKKTKGKETINSCSNIKQGSSLKRTARHHSSRRENNIQPLVTPQQYASRTAMLSSLIVAWSSVVRSFGVSNIDSSPNSCAILAVGGKSGHISFWRVYEPQCYTIESGKVPVDPVLVGHLQAHTSWITAISWGIHATSSSKTQLVLASGSCDGSVKIWLGDAGELTKSSEISKASFSLVREVTSITSAPISTMSLVVPVQVLDKVVLAIGRGSGSLEVWISHISSNTFESAGVYNVHNQVLTGLAWTSDGCYLYSCSQDNSVRSWVLDGSSLYETPFPRKFPASENSLDLSQAYDLCFGLALSPGELMVAVVRSFDSGQMHQMYQARTHKAAAEFYWTTRHSMGIPSDKQSNGYSGSTDGDLVLWESTILWSLTHYDNIEEPLVLWDVLTALRALKKSIPDFLKNILCKWISSWFRGYQPGDSIEKILFHVQSMLSKMSTRRMHLLNIICRLMRSEIKADACPNELHVNSKLPDEEGKLAVWNDLLANSERELRERFVSFTLKAVLSRSYCSFMVLANGTHWSPVGMAQMEQWVAINHALAHGELKNLAAKIGEGESRGENSQSEYIKESCSYCSAPVPFESPEYAKCEGVEHRQEGTVETHELKRCAVSMQLASVVAPMWYCICCRRWAAKLPPESFFTMSGSPLDVNYGSGMFAPQERCKPLCLFCGILMQRHLPDYLLSASPV
ncbi:uncharacterized protein M6B38_103820 [Iris pallida]|uniref:Transcription factor IIIC 90kDa subunit N-terminal domain-containing protein n=1 Tax=Iris pallida TaxID=29817 RepID=A0AAX6F384_IRIPA|nr:uncharacterized protein M6B38_103820 [Iris pallida]